MTFNEIKAASESIRKKTDFIPEAAVVLGSGLGGFAKNLDIVSEISYSEIEGFPVSTVSGHEGKFLFGTLSGKKVVLMQGRVHYYEGYQMDRVVLPIRVMKLLGAKKLILTNAAGGINPDFHAGDFMLIKDHISSFVPSPLRGKNIEELGARFPDMSHVYDEELGFLAQKAAEELNIDLKSGVYVQTAGPAYETPQEIRMYKLLGADAVGMSTACEATAAVHCGMRVCAISCISNLAAGISKNPLSHAEVKETADKAAPKFDVLIKKLIELI